MLSKTGTHSSCRMTFFIIDDFVSTLLQSWFDCKVTFTSERKISLVKPSLIPSTRLTPLKSIEHE